MFSKIRPIRTEADLKLVVELCKADNVVPMFPTHLVISPDERVVGYTSINNVPLVFFHLFKEYGKNPRDAFQIIEKQEDLVASLCNVKSFGITCAKDSPFYPLMEKMKYVLAGQLFLKNL